MGRKRSAEQKRVLAEALDKKRRSVPEASSAAAPVDSGTDPPPAGRFRRSCRTPIIGAVETATAAAPAPAGATETGGSHVTVRLPAPPAPPAREPRARAAALSPDACIDAYGTHARTTCTRLRCGAGCFGGFCCTDRALHVGRAAACLAGPAAVCLPLHPTAACAHARSIAASTRPLFAARRCRSGCECRRC